MVTRTRIMPQGMFAIIMLFSSMYMGSTNVDGAFGRGGLQTGFYALTCPSAEFLVQSAVSNALSVNKRTGAGLIRLLFHDCFVEGCDASVLLEGPNSEKTAQPNLSLHGFEVIDAAKAAVEAVCPGVVSCADILAIAARDSVTLLGGTPYLVETGRRDGTVSLASSTNDIPSPLNDVSALISSFAKKGLSPTQMVILSGAHTVGKAQCGAFLNRLYPTVDPTLDPAYAAQLQAICPQNGDATVLNDLDPTSPLRLDSNYFKNLIQNRGLLTSDQTLFTSGATKGVVLGNANFLWSPSFSQAIQAMGRVGVKTGANGEIRRNCHFVN
ncbi:hypothetical protein Mapa_016182 [Marchantia paleacea]|nr:hypothetical protein Mapa_016182 [Marchantia paleacea]